MEQTPNPEEHMRKIRETIGSFGGRIRAYGEQHGNPGSVDDKEKQGRGTAEALAVITGQAGELSPEEEEYIPRILELCARSNEELEAEGLNPDEVHDIGLKITKGLPLSEEDIEKFAVDLDIDIQNHTKH